jgi:hypothetical protein
MLRLKFYIRGRGVLLLLLLDWPVRCAYYCENAACTTPHPSMTILSRPQEGDLLTFENHYGYTQDAVNPVIPSAEFVLKVL